MAISKKSLGKVLAISMASAMAMSSLSAALVSVSAVQNPALASNGQVEFAELDGKISAEGVIADFFNMDDIDDDIVDAVGSGEKNLAELTNALKNASCAGFAYTDADGLEIPVEGIDVEYKVTSGTSYLKYDKTDKKLVAQDKSGSATLQIKVTGEADIGGGRDKKKVTFTQNIKFNVHQQGEIGLKAAIKNGTSYLNDADLNDLAAYGSIVKYQLVQYKISAGKDLEAVIDNVTIGDVGSSSVPGAPANQQKESIAKQAEKKLEDLIKAGTVPALTQEKMTAFLTALKGAISPVDTENPENANGPQTITKEAWDALADDILQEAGYAKVTPETKAVQDALKTVMDAGTGSFFKVADSPVAPQAGENVVDTKLYTKDANFTVKIDTVNDDGTPAAEQAEVYGKSTTPIKGVVKGDAFVEEIQEDLSDAKLLTINTDDGINETLIAAKVTSDPTFLSSKNVVKGEDGKYYLTTGEVSSLAGQLQIDTDETGQSPALKDVFTSASTATHLVKGGTAEAPTYRVLATVETVENTLYKVEWKGDAVNNKDETVLEVKVGDIFYYGTQDTETYPNATENLKPIVENAYKEEAKDPDVGGDGAGGGEGGAPVAQALIPGESEAITQIRFYAGSGQDLFDVVSDYDDAGDGSDWERSTKTNEDKGVKIVTPDANGAVFLRTNGSTGAGSIKVAVSHLPSGSPAGTKPKVDEITLNVKVVKAADFGGDTITLDRSGSKTYVSAGSDVTGEKNINGFEIRTTGGVTVENGTVGTIKNASSVLVNGGRVGNIDINDVNGTVEVTEDGTVGDIINAKTVDVNEGGQAGNITADADVTLSEGTIASIDVNGDVTISGGTVTGNVTATGDITISSDDTDGNDDALDTTIGGNVTLLAGGNEAAISINNVSDDGAASLSIRGNVIAKHVDTGDNTDTATISIGDADTTGLIQIGGTVEGEVVQLGGNGLVSLAGVRAASEVERTDDDGEIVESTLIFDGFNSAINSINNFADVKVNEGTVVVNGAVNTTNLTVNSDAQIVAQSITVEEDIMESGSIVVPVGKLTVTGSVDDSPTLALTGELTEGALAFLGNRGLVDAFDMGGVTLRAERQSNGNYNYLISKVELNGLTAIGKDVATGVKQEKKVSVALDGTLPEGASIVWESDDADIATVTGNGTDAVITGEDVGTTAVTAKIVDANGRELGYEDASFDVNVLDNATVDSIGGDIGPDDNQVDLDTKKKNMEAGQVYTFMVRGNNDVENISVTSGDANVATVALANGADSRGALYNITAVADGKTDITVTYQGKTSKIAVKVGGFQLDTSSKKMAPGQVYSVLAKNVPADQAGNVTLTYDSNIVDVVKVNDNYNGRGVLFNVTAKAIGETEVKLTHNGETETMAVNVVENTGRLTLDTASYTMPFGGSYTIGVKVEKNGRQLSGEEVRAMISSGELVVTDSRTGSIVTTEVQANGNVRVTGRQNEGTTYVQFIVMQNGQRVTHASVGVTVQNGATAGGSSVRSISQW